MNTFITKLKQNEIFVFGSNLAGRHGAGAALMAKKRFGAANGIGEGMQGQCYAIPTKDQRLQVLPLDQIRKHVMKFLDYADDQFEFDYLVTEIGCGLAGYKPHQIAPFFASANPNVILPESFKCLI